MGGLFLFNEYNSLDAINSAVEDCKRCQYGYHSRKVRGVGPSPSKLMIVGQNPGSKEVLTGTPFIGPSGRMLKNILKRINIDPNNVFMTNVVRCKPIDERKLASAAISICGSWLQYEVDLVRPKLIVALGNVASNYIIYKDAPSGVISTSIYGIPAIGTYHTAYILRLKNAAATGIQYSIDKYDEVCKIVEGHWRIIAKTIGGDSDE